MSDDPSKSAAPTAVPLWQRLLPALVLVFLIAVFAVRRGFEDWLQTSLGFNETGAIVTVWGVSLAVVAALLLLVLVIDHRRRGRA